MNDEVKVFLFKRVVGHLEEAYKNFLSLEPLLNSEEMEKLDFWNRAKKIHSVKKEMKDVVMEMYPDGNSL
ncbi:hypothetical protein [Desulfurobacterium crinifex]